MAGQNYISKINGAGISASYALTASYAMNGGGGATFPYVGTAVITGSLIVSGSPSTSSFNGLFQVKDSTGASVIISNTTTRSLYDNSDKLSIDFITRELTDNTPSISLNWGARALYDGQIPPTLSLDWSGRQLYYPNGTSAINYSSNNSVTITGVTTSTLGFTGSLFGTASRAINALTASFLLGSVTSASYAETASFLSILNQNLTISGNIIPAGPYANNTSSYSLGSPTAAWKDLYVSNGSVVLIDGVSSASMQFNNGTITFTGASVTLPSNSISPTSSFALAASGSLTGSLFGTASWATNFVSASNYVLNSQTSSMTAGTASKVTGGTANYVPLWTTGTTLGSSVLYQSSNNIGLGTTFPNTVLHISASSAQPLLNIENNTPTGYTNMRFTGTGRKYIIGVGNASETFFGIANDFFLYDDTSGNIRMIVDPNGNVGIGTVSPSSLLQVNGTVTANSFVGNLTGTASFASNLNNGVSFLGSGSIITGSTAISSSYGLYIPANTFTVGDIVKVQGVFTKPNAATSMQFYIYINTSNSLSGATQLAIYQTTTQRWNPITRTLAIESSTSTTLHPTNVVHYNDDIVLTAATARASVNINWAADQYLLFAAQNATLADRTDTFRFYAKKI